MRAVNGSQEYASLESDRWVLENLLDGAEGYLRAVDVLAAALGHLPRAQPQGDAPAAIVRHRLANHAANDGRELLLASFHGSRRSMLRSARALFEVAVATAEIVESDELAERYMAYEVLGRRAAVNLTRLDQHFSTKGRRSLRHRRRTVTRDADAEIRTGIARWGRSWARGWTATTLRDRAETQGLLDDYETFYRLASMPTHATAGGLVGTFSSEIGHGVHRYGPALQACPVALVYGLVYLRLTTDTLGPTPDLEPVLSAIGEVEANIGEYGAVVLWLDESMWPKDAPIERMAVLSVYRGHWRWLCHDLEMARIVDAHPPDDLPGAQRRNLEASIEEHSSGPLSVTEPLVIGVVGVRVRPKAGAAWLPASDVLPPRPLFVRPHYRDRLDPQDPEG